MSGRVVHCGDWRDFLPGVVGEVVAVTDPPFGIAYESGMFGELPRSIAGDEDTRERDEFLQAWGERPALVFGSWRVPRPTSTRALLVWDSKGALGMGDLAMPWKPSHQEIYVLGRGFTGKRGTDVLRYAPVQAMAKNGRVHPHQKPVDLMVDLLDKCPREWVVVDPFCGSGSTGVACVRTGHRFIGVEIDPNYAAIARDRIAQEEAQCRMVLA